MDGGAGFGPGLIPAARGSAPRCVGRAREAGPDFRDREKIAGYILKIHEKKIIHHSMDLSHRLL